MSDQPAVLAVPFVQLSPAQSFQETAQERIEIVAPKHITVDIPSAVTTVFGAIPAIMAQKPAIDATFKAFPMRLIDRLPLYASGALYAHSTWLFSTTPTPELQELLLTCTGRRVRLVSVADTAVVHELIPADVLEDLQGAKGHRNVAVDIIGVCGVLRRHWTTLEGKVPLTLADLDRDEQMAHKLIQVIGARELAPAADGPAAQDRKLSWGLLAYAYDEIREAARYVRRAYGDLERIAPSFYAGRGGRGRKGDDEPEPQPVVSASDVQTGPSVPAGHPDSNPLTDA